MTRKTVAIGLVGTTLDNGFNEARWKRWRPSIALCQHPAFPIDRFELLASDKGDKIASQVVADVATISPHTEVRRHALALTDPWDFGEVYGALGDFADRYRFRDDEDYYLHITTGTHVVQICLFLLCETRAIPGRLVQTSPGPDASGRIDVIDLDLAKYDRLAARFKARRARGASLLKAGIETRNAAFNRMIDELEHVATRSRDPLLLTGETGTGTSALCDRIYELKRARQHVGGELVAVNCATLRGDTAMSALFGHVRGAFTGAAEGRTGFLKKADKGLLFLDEIGELGRDEQAMLLVALETQRFYPVGADKPTTSAFQLVAGTNRDLGADVASGRFREDLLARLALWPFRLPALRERVEDHAPNLDYELDRISAELGTRASLSKPARDTFLAFAATAAWRANFREFNAAIRRMVTLADGGRVDEPGVRAEAARLEAIWRGVPARDAVDLAAHLGERAASLDRFDRVQLADVIAVCTAAPTLSAAGRALFAHSLATRTSKNDADRLRKYLARFDLSFESIHGKA